MRKLEFPDDKSIAAALQGYADLPVSLVSTIVASLGPLVRSAYGDTALSTLTELLGAEKRRSLCKMSVYIGGINCIHDSKLRAKLLEELIMYAGKSLNITVDEDENILDAQEFQSLQFSSAELLETVSTINQAYQRQLDKATDPALILHLSVLGLFTATHPGTALRATGKLVPKILRELANDVDQDKLAPYVELKNAILAKAANSKELANRLRK
jgi:hypothetical protein